MGQPIRSMVIIGVASGLGALSFQFFQNPYVFENLKKSHPSSTGYPQSIDVGYSDNHTYQGGYTYLHYLQHIDY